MMHRLLKPALVCLVALATLTTVAYGQGSFFTTLSGTVVDSSGGVIPGADIKAKHNGTGAESNTVTAVNGTFSIPSLPGGTYSVTVSLSGFKTKVLNAVTLSAAIPATVRVELEVGTVAESVTVVGESGSIVQTATPAVATNITSTQILRLPLSSRNALESLTSLAGFNTAAGSRQSTISGLPRSAINITLDGMSIQDNYLKTTDGFFARLSPRLDAVEEVTVTTAGNTADSTGQGAAQIKFVTRMGSNKLSGSAYQYYRTDALNSNTWFNNRDLPPDPKTGKAPKAELNQYQPGFRLGGAIVIPGLWDGHNKAFFFVNYEEFRQPSTSTLNRNIFTSAAEQGIFSYTAGGQTRQVNLLQLAAANGQTSTRDPIVAKLLSDIRASTATTGGLSTLANPLLDRYTWQTPTTNYNPYPTFRIDYNLSRNHRLTGSMNYQHINSTPDTTNNAQSPFPGFPTTGSQQSTRWTTSESLVSTFGTSLVNEFRVGATGGATFFSPELTPSMWKGANGIADQGGLRLNFAGVCCGTGNANQLTNPGLGGTGTAAGAQQVREASTRVMENTLSWTKGRHSWSFGGSWTQADVWITLQTLVPSVNFGIVAGDPAAAMFTAANFPGAATADLNNARALYAILTGRISSLTADARLTEAADKYVVLGKSRAEGRLHNVDFFAADSWRVRPNLTISYGVRYAVQPAFAPLNNSYTKVTEGALWGISGVGNIFKPNTLTGEKPAYVQYPQGEPAYRTDRNNWAPSVGFSWSPDPRSGLLGRLIGAEGDSVIRGGYATAYQRPGMSDFTGVFGANQGLTITAERSLNSGTLGPLPALLRDSSATQLPTFVAAPAYPIFPSVTNSVNAFDSNLEVPYTKSWTIGYQRKLSRDAALELRYVGSRHEDDWLTLNLNELNIVENGFLNEFKLAQQNLAANVAAGRGPTFRYAGPGTGTSPLPIILAYFQGATSAQASDAANYTSASFGDSLFINTLARFNPNPCCGTTANTNPNPSFAFSLQNSSAFRANASRAGLPANFFVANPDVASAALTTNGGGTNYHSMQVELRKRFSGGVQFGSSYVFGRAYRLNRYSFRRPFEDILQTGTDGGVTHAFKGNWVWELPFGSGYRWGSALGPVLDRLVGGWSLDGVVRIQTGEMLNIGNVRLVGMTEDELRSAMGLRTHTDGHLYVLPQDILDNTVKAFSVNATSATGYGASGPPSGRYLAPANGPDCIEVAPGYGDCGGRSLVITGPRLVRFDLGVAKRVRLVGRTTFEFRAEMLNAFNNPYFLPVSGFTTFNYTGAGAGIGIPISNAITTNQNNFRLVEGIDLARVIQLVWRVTW